MDKALRLLVAALLLAIAVLQFMTMRAQSLILEHMPPTLADFRRASSDETMSKETRLEMLGRIPYVSVQGSVDVEGTVDVSSIFDPVAIDGCVCTY